MASRDAAVAMVEEITAEAEVGAVYTGTVARIVDFGAFVNILPGKDGLVHISQIANERVENVTDHLSEGEEVQVKVSGRRPARPYQALHQGAAWKTKRLPKRPLNKASQLH